MAEFSAENYNKQDVIAFLKRLAIIPTILFYINFIPEDCKLPESDDFFGTTSQLFISLIIALKEEEKRAQHLEKLILVDGAINHGIPEIGTCCDLNSGLLRKATQPIS